ncbi:hypothetical protein PHSC3_002047 [Chlamydiales bacterium STE3]|nr:hypothetical protein PHSC3_002047 [Chlamydiales bacterium STE3]
MRQADMEEKTEEHPFYDVDVFRHQEQEYIKQLLLKYKKEPVSEDLKKKIWDELQMEKHSGRIKIPFKVVLKRDAYRKYPDTIEVILDTKV